ncbi:MAG TPA: sigma 54-interacting transcriptional regulator [Candidatus Limnocylindria bacterium]|nr:sigma 54-interacting transcriptional regulator [Candidatus Limnocylindria bacterium]
MNVELLQSISLAVAQERRMGVVLNSVVSGLADSAGFALARIWLLNRPTAGDPSLELAASAGRSQVDGLTWTRLTGEFAKIQLGVRKIGHIAASGESLHLRDEVADSHWTRHPEWVRREGIQGFVGHPLIFRGEILGVLAVFSRSPIDDSAFKWLRVFAGQAAVAIANARAFEEIDRLREKLESENEYLKTEARENSSGLLGTSPALRKVMQEIDLVAPTDSSVLISGESGTGKELVARAIHERSKRRDRTLVRINCASVPRELFESEFFGHVRGSFTGAIRDRVGRFQLADGGTLFLDEVGEIPLDLQSKLLRVLQEGEYERVGEEQTRRTDVRILAATNRDLTKEVAAGRFREDLFFRLSVFPLQVPALRERRDDIPLLAEHFLHLAAKRLGYGKLRLSPENLDELIRYSWPGNVRELQNVIERAVILSGGRTLRFSLQEPIRSKTLEEGREPANSRPLTRQQIQESQRESIEAALKRSHGKIYGPGGAAEILGLRPTTLNSKIAALGISRHSKD